MLRNGMIGPAAETVAMGDLVRQLDEIKQDLTLFVESMVVRINAVSAVLQEVEPRTLRVSSDAGRGHASPPAEPFGGR